MISQAALPPSTPRAYTDLARRIFDRVPYREARCPCRSLINIGRVRKTEGGFCHKAKRPHGRLADADL
jgi:hypothetical protein